MGWVGGSLPACSVGTRHASIYSFFFLLLILRKKHEGRGWELEGSEMAEKCMNLIDLIKFN